MTARALRLCSERGSAFVELALTLPLLVVVLFAMADFARAYHTAMQLSNMARAGAQAGAVSLAASNDTAAMEAAAEAAGSITGVTATAAQICYCAADSGTSFPVVDCLTTTSCVGGGGGHLYVYTQVDASATFRTATRIPGIPTDILMTRRATMRVVN
jgi:Flp pilus assembly protein TadG